MVAPRRFVVRPREEPGGSSRTEIDIVGVGPQERSEIETTMSTYERDSARPASSRHSRRYQIAATRDREARDHQRDQDQRCAGQHASRVRKQRAEPRIGLACDDDIGDASLWAGQWIALDEPRLAIDGHLIDSIDVAVAPALDD